MATLTRRNHDWVFASRKRAIFLAWRQVAKQEIGFMLCIKNVLTKSMLTKGFLYIQKNTRNDLILDKIKQRMNIVMLRYEHDTVKRFFDTWKTHNLMKVKHKF